MGKRYFSTLFLFLIFGFGLGAHAYALERRVALVIGNAKYPVAPLTNPHNDARDMAATLRSGGFEVIELIDGTQKEMNRAIARFGDKLTLDTVAFFYYAGHGMQVRGKNYLIPVDAQISNESSIRVESVDVDGVLDQLGSSELNVVILDACRNNPFERRFRTLGGGLAQMDAPKGSLIAYATAPGKTAADGDGRNGLFTQELLKQIKVPGLTIEQVFKNVRREVARATRDNQIPWESSSMTGDFYFVPTQRQPVANNAGTSYRPMDRIQSNPVQPTVQAVSAESLKGAVVQESLISLPKTPPALTKAETADSGLPIESQSAAAALTTLLEKPAVVGEPTSQTVKTEAFTVTGRLLIDSLTGAMTGEGTIAWFNGDRYEGALVGGKKQGKGIFVWRDGQRYEGDWANDMINGRGVLFYVNGDRYEGDFVNGEPHGAGVYTLRNGDVYKGAWANGNKHGHGRLTWSSGDYWEGEFRDDVQTANGKLVYGEDPDEPADRGISKAAMPVKPAPSVSASAKSVPIKKGK